MADEKSEFPVELIPSEDSVFMRAFKDRMKDGKPSPSAFKPHGNGQLSVDWEKYSTAEQTRNRAKCVTDNAVVSMIVADIRHLDLDVIHVPLPENRSHSEIDFSESETEMRLKLSRIAKVEIALTV